MSEDACEPLPSGFSALRTDHDHQPGSSLEQVAHQVLPDKTGGTD
jgi:hypothetical protein